MTTKTPGRSGWVLAADDTYAFAVGLLGLWHAGHHAVLPPNRQDQTFAELDVRTHGFLTDYAPWLRQESALHPVTPHEVEAHPDLPDVPLSENALAVELYTSGTTGDHRSIRKELRHLESEVAELSSLFRDLPSDAVVFSTASPQHLYGLLFAVLWPLATGRKFDPDPLHQPSEIVPRMLSVDHSILVSVPSTLRQLARHDATPQLEDRCKAVFSSGGPLPSDIALDLAKQLGKSPIEVFGSTETGGVAWRQQSQANYAPAWRPFPSVRTTLSEPDGLLCVCSPFVSVDEDQTHGFMMSDRISLRADGCFTLKGRSDQVVKIAEKRVDLTQMANVLRRHVAVEDAALATIEREGHTRVGAAIVPSARGLIMIENEGRSELNRRLRECLQASFDPVVHPRSWRHIDALPIDERGKTRLNDVRALFRKASPREIVDRPEIKGETRGADFIERACRVPVDLISFAGHFPSLPVVPGFLQLDWAMELIAVLNTCADAPKTSRTEPQIQEIESLKLISPLRPGQEFKIHVRRSAENRVTLEITSSDAVHARGRVRLESYD